ncbi:prepilin-type N-terminal cleavage/methylation domain-containing protein [Romboutsia ilealis]|uniref:Prepilin-type N-terminal cleavage/methylation domain-containing protein n=1 Tax=Romboutsia faecis TaxID=2764597 RepID=A0ABR7JSX2_9FIRM|nr:prepilin-type N-terminal cleavage/methylation domain-containing protein [Romboutsia faecis]MBC5998011.1 prepilin-type N-terminal cleavage/methylation domain-containing protein [Romboutsia faecis]MRN25702.1 prepilin-type N-terminal cleavage/methylation domain-containing protein [Romboutsia ilealis]
MAKKNNKGFSLIEIIISLAIASIMILSGYQLIINAVKLNKKGEDRQQANLVGQQVIEEIKTIDDRNISTNLLTINENLILTGTINGNINEYKGTLLDESGEYDVNIFMEKEDVEFKENNYNSEINYDLRYDISNANDNLVIKNSENHSVSNISLNDNKNFKIILENSDKLDGNVDIDNNCNEVTLNIKSKDEIFLDFTNYNFNKDIDIEIYNNLDKKLKIYIQKPMNTYSNVNARSIIGLIEIYNNPIFEKIGYSYKVKVIVKKYKNILFEGYTNKNMKKEINEN